jgi:arabinose-5-phosphate isomerase
MKDTASIIKTGKNVVRIEAAAVAQLEERINENFARAVDTVYNSRGRVVITGMGKSGIIARKIGATLNSTGTPAMFLHPSDAVHGDYGMVRKEDVVICISKSGNTRELIQLIPLFKRSGVPIIAMVANQNSPTSSTTATLVMGDAFAMALLDKRNFTVEDFALYHPGGNLGRRLLLKIEEMMVSGKNVPVVKNDVSLRDVILEITSKRLGATCVIDGSGVLVGIVTDGDLRRLLQKTTDLTHQTAEMVMTCNPKTISKDVLAAMALQEMESFKITQLIVVDDKHRPIGIIHLHELVEAGLGREYQ